MSEDTANARFATGDSVSVRRMFPPGHIRTPRYVMGLTGEICHVVGEFPNPEELAYGRNGCPKKMLYRVRFQLAGIWVDYAGAPKDTIEIELYDHWLMRALEGSPRMSYDHSHAHSHGPASKDDDDRLTYWRAMEIALRELLIEKGILTADGVRGAVEAMDARMPENGARLVARAWSDSAFKARLLADGSAAAGEMGFEVGTLKLMVIENTPAVHNLVVCTLCSCYPRMLIGLPPAWYKSAAYRKRAVHEPRAVLREFGTIIPGDVEVRVHDSTADLRYMILPLRPAGTDSWSEEQLVPLVTRDSLVGVTVALPPAPHCAPSPARANSA